MATVFSLIKVFHQTRKLFAGVCLLAGLQLLPASLCWAGSGGMGGEGITGGDGLPTEEDCRSCHDNLFKFPTLEEGNVNKHHHLVGSEIVLSTAPPEAEFGDTYNCLFCHPVVWDQDLNGYKVSLFRDCLVCHAIETVSGPPRMQGSNRHHKLGYSCSVCHEQRR